MTQIPDFPDYYIDDNFDVWSKKDSKLKKKIPHQHNHGYLRFSFKKDGKKYIKYLHRIIAETFIPNPENLPCVRHLDDNPLNNSIENLCWGNQKQNMNDKVKNGNSAKGEKHPQVKLTEQQVIEIRKKYIPKKYTQYKLSKEYSVSRQYISLIINNKNWKHI